PAMGDGLIQLRFGWIVARGTRVELATSGVTGRRSNQLSYTRVFGVGAHLGAGLWGVNHRGLHFLALILLFLIWVADVGQGPVFKQESGDVRSACSREDRLHDDEQWNGQQRPGRSPHPGPEGQ